MIPIAKPTIGEEEIRSVMNVLRSGVIAQGPKVKEFEENFSNYIGNNFGIATNSGTAALHVAMLAHGIGSGDEVITTPFSFIATANSIKYVGAKPVFSDINEDYNFNIEKIAEKINDKTKAIIAVHLFGLPCDMSELNDLVEDNDLILIEDCAQSHGAEYEKKKVGSYGTGCFSFYPTKNITTSEGGMITTNDEKICERAQMIRNHGMRKRYHHEMTGFNLRMTDIEAAIGVEQLKKLDNLNQRRIDNATYYNDSLKDIIQIKTPVNHDDRKHVYHQYTIRVEDRDELAPYLTKKGIGSGIYYPLLIDDQFGYEKENCIQAEVIKNEVISLPVHPNVSKENPDYIIESLEEFYA